MIIIPVSVGNDIRVPGRDFFVGYRVCGRLQNRWYDGFTFGSKSDIYNPWSVINFLDTGKTAPYLANTSSSSLVGKLIREGSRKIKTAFEFSCI